MALNNIGNMMKIMNAWNIFKRNHPKFPAFCNAVSKRALKEGSIMAITVTTPDGEKIETNLRIKAEDLELLKELTNLPTFIPRAFKWGSVHFWLW